MGTSELSIVIPAFNEEKRIAATLETLRGYLARQNYESEIIVVDDGSKDRTVETARMKLEGCRHRVLPVAVNTGKGNAVREGMLAAEGRYVLFTDADLSTPIEEVERFLRYLKEGNDVVIGSRALDRSKIEVRQNFSRELMGKVFNLIARMLVFREVRDSQCGFKAFTREAARDLFGRQKTKGFSFDAEILYLAQKKGYRIREEPVIWRNSEQSKVRILSDPLLMLRDLLVIRWIHR